MEHDTPAPAVPAPETPAPYAEGTGTAPIPPDREALARMSYRERLALKRQDPEGYAALCAAGGAHRP